MLISVFSIDPGVLIGASFVGVLAGFLTSAWTREGGFGPTFDVLLSAVIGTAIGAVIGNVMPGVPGFWTACWAAAATSAAVVSGTHRAWPKPKDTPAKTASTERTRRDKVGVDR